MRTNLKRRRQPDPLASPHAVRSLLAKLRAALPRIIPCKEKDLIRMLRAVRHLQRYAASDTRRGRPSHFKRQDLLTVATTLTDILERETSSHLSLSSFIDHYLRLLDFPADIILALGAGQINLFEAAQLARITPARLATSPAQTRRTRADLLSTHLQTKESGPGLRLRVNELLRPANEKTETDQLIDSKLELEDFDPYDPTHLFWDQIRQLGFALRAIGPQDVTEEEIDELLKASEPILTVLARVQRRTQRKRLKLPESH